MRVIVRVCVCAVFLIIKSSHQIYWELLNSLNFFCFFLSISSYTHTHTHTDWSLAMRLRMRVSSVLFSLSFCVNLKQQNLASAWARYLFAFHVIRFRWPFSVCSFVYLFISWRFKDAEISFLLSNLLLIYSFFIVRNLILIFVLFE